MSSWRFIQHSIQFNSILEWMDDDCFDREYNLERLIHSFWFDWFLLKQWNEVPHAHYFICADYSTVLSTRVNKYIITNTLPCRRVDHQQSSNVKLKKKTTTFAFFTSALYCYIVFYYCYERWQKIDDLLLLLLRVLVLVLRVIVLLLSVVLLLLLLSLFRIPIIILSSSSSSSSPLLES